MPGEPTERAGQATGLSRRKFLTLGVVGGVAALGGIAYGVDTWVAGSTPWPNGEVSSYRSRPDLQPPAITVNVTADDVAPGFIFLAPSGGPGQYGPMIMDNYGQPVWFNPLSGPWSADTTGLGDLVAANFKMQHYRGRPVLTWWQGMIVLPGFGKGQCMVLDERYQKVTTVKTGNGVQADLHEFVITAEDTALVSYYQPVAADLSAAGGPAKGYLLDSGFQEIDMASGKVLYQWRASDHIDLTESYYSVAGTGTRAMPWDFFHLNSVEKDSEGNYLVSARHTWTAYKLHGGTGEVVWRLNGKRSDFDVGPDAQFSWQHDARWQPGDRVSIFDDGAGQFTTNSRARGIIVNLDFAAMTAKLNEEYVHPGPIMVASQGSMQVLPNDNAFVGWGSEPYVSEFADDGRLLFDAALPTNGVSYRAFRYPWTGAPDERPAVAVASGPTITPFGTQGSATQQVYASWNGATEFASWQVLAGPSQSALRAVKQAKRKGFETAIPWTGGANDKFVAVAALDATGRVLARSAVVSV
jgi:hypothetical protein